MLVLFLVVLVLVLVVGWMACLRLSSTPRRPLSFTSGKEGGGGGVRSRACPDFGGGVGIGGGVDG